MKHWQDINWHEVIREVRQLQAEIVRAAQAGNQRKMIILQDRLVQLRAARLLAVRQVTTNSGKHTPGVDGEVWNTPQQKTQAAERLNIKGYRPQPARRVNIPKNEHQTRPLGILTMLDRAMQALYLFALDPIAEVRADPHSYGFRKYRAARDAIAYCYEIFGAKDSPQWVLEADIKQCFDTIAHDWLLHNIPLEKSLLRAWLRAGYRERGRFHKTPQGLPQGGILSPTLANMALDGMESMLLTYFHHSPQRQKQSKIAFVRYADDFFVASASKTMLQDEVKPLLENFLGERGMSFSEQKTTITLLKHGFDFLGYHLIRESNFFGKQTLIITPSAKSFDKVLTTIKNTIQKHHASTATQLIQALNPIISGWTRYYSFVESEQTFAQFDREVFDMLCTWAKQRHPRKFRRWILKTYFTRVKGQMPVFSDHQEQTLCCAQDTPMCQYEPIDPLCNAYDPKWSKYLKNRQ